MNNSQTIEPSGGEPTSPPPLPGRSAAHYRWVAELYVQSIRHRSSYQNLSLPDELRTYHKKWQAAFEVAASEIARYLGAESETPEGWSDPGNTSEQVGR